MAERIKGLQIDLSLNDMGISKKLADVKREFRSLNTSMKTSSNNFKYGDKSAKSYKDRMSELQGAVEGSSKRLDTLKKRHAGVVEAEGAGSKSALRYADEINRETDTLNMYKDQLSRVTQGYRENFSVAGKLSKSFSSIGSGFKAVGNKAQSVGASLSSKITKPALVAGTAMAGITAKMGFDRLKGLDTAKAKLEGLGYSGKEVKSITDQVTEAVKGGMTTLGEGTDIAAGALAAGVKEGKDLKKYIQLVGDAAAGANRPVGEMATIFNRVQGQGKLMTEELNSIEDGMPGFSQAMMKHLGVKSMEAFKEMVSNGEVGSEDFLKVMDSFAGGMSKAYAKSWEGMVQNTKAFVGIIGENFLEGVFPQSKNALADFNEKLQSKAVQNWSKNAGAYLKQGVDVISNKIKELVSWWDSLDSSTQSTLGNIAKWSGILLVALGPMLTIFGKITSSVGGLFVGLSNLLGPISKAGGLFEWIAGIVGGLNLPMIAISAVIAGIATAMFAVTNKGKSFGDILSGLADTVQGSIQWFTKLGGAIKDILSPKTSDNNNAMATLKKMFGAETGKEIYNSLMNIKETIVNAFNEITGFFKQQAQGILKFWDENGSQFIEALQNFWAIVKPIFTVALGIVVSLIKSVWGNIKGIISGAVKVIEGIIKVFTGIFTGDFSKMWEGVKDIFSGAIKIILNWINLQFVGKILKGFKGLGKGSINFVKSMWSSVKSFFTGGIKGTKGAVAGWVKGVISDFKGLVTSAKNRISNMWKVIKNLFTKGIVTPIKAVANFGKSIISKFTSLRKSGNGIVKSMWGAIKDVFSGSITKVKNLVTGMKKAVVGTVGKMRDGIKGIVDKIKGYFTGMVTAVKKGLNKLIDGVNWVGGKLGMKKLGKIKLSTGTETTETHNVVTNGKINRDTFATVGDKGKGNGPRGFRQEMIRYPNGKLAMTPNKDTTAYLPKGSSVFNGQQTYNAMHGLPQFAGGTWDKIKGAASNAWSKTKETVGKGAGWLKDKVGDIMDYVSHPGKLLDKVLKAFGVNFDFINGSLPKNLMSGMFGKLKTAAKELIQTWLESADGGDFDGKMGKHGVYKYLWDIAQKVMKKFPGMRYTSGYRKGDPYSHGKHQAVDIAYPASANHSSKYFKPANWAFDNFKKQIAYVITQGKVKDRSGKSGQGKSGNWKHWPDNDHYDHLHLNGMWGPGDIAKNPGGKGVKRWRSYVQKALKKNGLPASNGHINSWLSQINTESSGNPNAVQGYIPGDPNNGNPARGLLQTIPSTFKAHAFKGHKNIMNGYDSILAAIHYAKSRYGKNGMYQVIGHGHGYATGGLINTPGWYNLSERGFGEYVIPKDPSKQSDAMKLLDIAANDIGKRDKNKRPNQMRVPSGNTSTQQDKDNRELNQKLNTLISMFGQLLGLNSAQLQAIKDGAFDKSQLYKQQALDQSNSDWQMV